MNAFLGIRALLNYSHKEVHVHHGVLVASTASTGGCSLLVVCFRWEPKKQLHQLQLHLADNAMCSWHCRPISIFCGCCCQDGGMPPQTMRERE